MEEKLSKLDPKYSDIPDNYYITDFRKLSDFKNKIKKKIRHFASNSYLAGLAMQNLMHRLDINESVKTHRENKNYKSKKEIKSEYESIATTKEFIVYDNGKAAKVVSFDDARGDVGFKVYSPVGKTGFGVAGNCTR